MRRVGGERRPPERRAPPAPRSKLPFSTGEPWVSSSRESPTLTMRRSSRIRRRAGFVTAAGRVRDSGRRSRKLWGADGPHRFPHPPALRRSAARRGRRGQARPAADELSRQRAQARRGRARASVQRPRRRIRKHARGGFAQERVARRRPAHPRRRRRRRTSTTCSRRSSTPASTIWRRRRSRWARGG